jgi:hypothetical protein
LPHDGLPLRVQVLAPVPLTAKPTLAIAIAPTTAPVIAKHDRLEQSAAQGASDQSDKAVSHPAKAMLVQRSCRKMSAS